MKQRILVTMMAAVLGATAAMATAAEKEENVAYTDVPAVVQTAFEKDYPKATVEEVEKETADDGKVTYEFEFKNAEGKKREVTYSAEGKKLGEDKDDD